MQKNNPSLALAAKRVLTLVLVIALSACSSTSSAPEVAEEASFDNATFMSALKEQHENCELEYMSPDHNVSYWQTKKESESTKYSWVEYSDYSDYYEYRLEDPSYAEYDLADVENAKKCIAFITSEINSLASLEDEEAKTLGIVYNDLLNNRQDYLVQSEAMAALEINKANRSKYMAIEDKKRSLTSVKEVIFFKIRELIDFRYVGAVKVFLERCPDAFSVMGNDTIIDGSVLLTNTSGSDQQVDLTFRFKDTEGVVVGDDLVYETVPGDSKLRASISAAGSSGAVGGGATYPPNCSYR